MYVIYDLKSDSGLIKSNICIIFFSINGTCRGIQKQYYALDKDGKWVAGEDIVFTEVEYSTLLLCLSNRVKSLEYERDNFKTTKIERDHIEKAIVYYGDLFDKIAKMCWYNLLHEKGNYEIVKP